MTSNTDLSTADLAGPGGGRRDERGEQDTGTAGAAMPGAGGDDDRQQVWSGEGATAPEGEATEHGNRVMGNRGTDDLATGAGPDDETVRMSRTDTVRLPGGGGADEAGGMDRDDGTAGGMDRDDGTAGGMDAGMDAGMDRGMDRGMAGGTDPGTGRGMGGGMGAGTDRDMGEGMDRGSAGGMDPGTDRGMGGGTDRDMASGMDRDMSGGTDRDMGGGMGGDMRGGMSGGTDRDMGGGMTGGTDGAAGHDIALLDTDAAEGFRSRWSDAQTRFVDDPREAVRTADSLVAELMQSLAQGFDSHRQQLETQWNSGGEADTESLRQALQRYRSFFDRLLST